MEKEIVTVEREQVIYKMTADELADIKEQGRKEGREVGYAEAICHVLDGFSRIVDHSLDKWKMIVELAVTYGTLDLLKGKDRYNLGLGRKIPLDKIKRIYERWKQG